MSDEFYQRFGNVELGPESQPKFGEVLYERTPAGLVKRYEYDSTSGWGVDVKTGQKAYRIDDQGRAVLPNGKHVPWPTPRNFTPKVSETAKRLFESAKPKHGYPFGHPGKSAAQPHTDVAHRLFRRVVRQP